jgi:hypothetical protein
MPKFLEEKLKKEYPNNPGAVYGTMNAIGAMHGNKETKKGAAMERKHIEHVHQHLQTEHHEPHKGHKADGSKHDGHVAGSMPEHKHHPGLVHHYSKKA